jgi:hypothetical protein
MDGRDNMNILNTFDKSKITYTTNLNAILALDRRDRLIDILPRIYVNRTAVAYDKYRRAVHGTKQFQSDILNTWIQHFEGQGIPIALTEGRNNQGYYLVMWKEKRI